MPLKCRLNFRSCAAKWPAERNPAKGAEARGAPLSRQWGCRPNRAGIDLKWTAEDIPHNSPQTEKVAGASPTASDATD